MKTTLILKDELLKQAQKLTGIKDKATLINRGLEALIQEAVAKNLIKLGGVDPHAIFASRKKS